MPIPSLLRIEADRINRVQALRERLRSTAIGYVHNDDADEAVAALTLALADSLALLPYPAALAHIRTLAPITMAAYEEASRKLREDEQNEHTGRRHR